MGGKLTIRTLCIILAFFGCSHPYEPPPIPFNSRPLVVEAVINANPDATTTVMLSRVQNLAEGSSSSMGTPEPNAVVTLEAEDGTQIALPDQGKGQYTAEHLNLMLYANYRVNITTADGNRYQSDFVHAKLTPPIDSLEWNQNSDVTIYVNTHDPLDSTIYYRWDFVETWNYLANLNSIWGLENRKIFLKDSLTQTDSCWRTQPSTDIVTASSVAYSQDVISHYQVTTIPEGSEKLSNRYSILVKQYALTKEAYEYYQTLRKNTQQTGSLFDPQPLNLPTNVHCLTHPAETVIGFVSASTVEEKRIFIDHTQISNWKYEGVVSSDCSYFIYVDQNPTDFSIFDYPDTTYGPYYFITNGPLVLVSRSCTECTYYGGSNVKPSFWQ
jgi:Domain of unknown function (DUF4249)